MIDRKQTLVGGVAAALLLSSGLVQAALSEPIDGMVYDDVLDLCWLQDASASGTRDWINAVGWADTLEFGGHTDWRLARMSSTSPTDTPFDCSVGTEQDCTDSGNELGYMFYYNLPDPFPKQGNQGPFLNIPFTIWSGTEFASLPGFAWSFNPADGFQGVGGKDDQFYGWAVRPGQCRAAPADATAVPAVGALGLGLLGLLLAGIARSRLR